MSLFHSDGARYRRLSGDGQPLHSKSGKYSEDNSLNPPATKSTGSLKIMLIVGMAVAVTLAVIALIIVIVLQRDVTTLQTEITQGNTALYSIRSHHQIRTEVIVKLKTKTSRDRHCNAICVYIQLPIQNSISNSTFFWLVSPICLGLLKPSLISLVKAVDYKALFLA